MLCMSHQRLAYSPEIPYLEPHNLYPLKVPQDVTRLTQRVEGSKAASLSARLLAL